MGKDRRGNPNHTPNPFPNLTGIAIEEASEMAGSGHGRDAHGTAVGVEPDPPFHGMF